MLQPFKDFKKTNQKVKKEITVPPPARYWGTTRWLRIPDLNVLIFLFLNDQ